MLLAGPLGDNPRAVAERLREQLEADAGLAPDLERIEVAGPGFVNFFLADSWYLRALAALLEAGDRLGASAAESPEKVLVEFVSANPTGPIHVGTGRNAAYGDSLVRLLQAAGHEVEREYYVNDAGSQIGRFADSIAARMRGEEPPEDGYAGDVRGRDRRAAAGRGGRPRRPRDAGKARDRGGAGGSRADAGALRRPLRHLVLRAQPLRQGRGRRRRSAELEKRGHTYRHEDALWLRTTDFGDDKDRVLIRSNGEATYLTPDIAYHWDKLQRGFERLIDVLGADHHGYVARVRAAIEALGADPAALRGA